MAFYLISIQRGDKGFWVSVSFSKGGGALLSGFSVLGEGTSWAWVLHGRRPLWDLSLSLTQESSVEYLRYFSEYSKIFVWIFWNICLLPELESGNKKFCVHLREWSNAISKYMDVPYITMYCRSSKCCKCSEDLFNSSAGVSLENLCHCLDWNWVVGSPFPLWWWDNEQMMIKWWSVIRGQMRNWRWLDYHPRKTCLPPNFKIIADHHHLMFSKSLPLCSGNK